MNQIQVGQDGYMCVHDVQLNCGKQYLSTILTDYELFSVLLLGQA